MSLSRQGPDARATDEHLRGLDVQFGRAVVRWARPAPSVVAARALEAIGSRLSAALGEQAPCLPLAALAEGLGMAPAAVAGLLGDHGLLRPATPGAPFVVDADRLYLARYHDYEMRVAAELAARAARVEPLGAAERAALAERLAVLFPTAEDGAVNLQRLAAAIALERGLAVITGGPGTGKTTTVTRLLVLLSERADAPLRIRLAAPTGKAAARLTESLRESRTRLAASGDVDAAVLDRLPDQAGTLHRLLGYRPLSQDFRHGPDRPVPADLVVIDEASMVDLRMMAHLLCALAPSTRLVLLGDADQLSSVEAGQVLGDLCAWAMAPPAGRRWTTAGAEAIGALAGMVLDDDAAADVPPLADALCVLRVSHRFDAASGPGRLAAAVNAGDGEAATALLAAGTEGLRLDDSADPAALIAAAVAGHRAAVDLARSGAAPAEVLRAFSRFQVLCAMRAGEFGVDRINAAVEAELRREMHAAPGRDDWAGRPIMVTVNDYGLGLFNGDVGVMLTDADGRLQAFFPTPEGEVRGIRPSRLPAHETVFAMTVHKSQGSEFDAVLVALPPAPNENAQRLLTRELFYTALTRARRVVAVAGDRAVIRAAIERRTERASGLAGRLWGDVAGSAG